MRRHAKALSAGSSMRQGGRLGFAAAFAFTLVLGVTVASAAAPTVTIENVANGGYTTAQVKGTVDRSEQSTTYRFQYATQPDFSDATTGIEATLEDGGPGPQDVAGELTGLAPGATYYLRLQAENGDGSSEAQAAAVFTTKAVAAPTVTINQVSSVSATSAHFSGSVNPNAPGAAPQDPAFDTSWHFECAPSCAGGGEVVADDVPHTVEATATGLEPNTHYTVKLVAENKGGSAEAGESAPGAPVEFTTDAVAPAVSYLLSAPVREVTDSAATVQAWVNPRNSALTDCHFEWGASEGYGHSVPCAINPGSGAQPVLTEAHLVGLSAGTTYHLRVVAGNAVAPTEGADQSFATFPSAPAPGPCPNEAFRREQQATGLPDCRAYEMVSPLDKNGGNINGQDQTVIASTEGGGVVFSSRTGFGDTIGSAIAGLTQYLARRNATGWDFRGITPTASPDAIQALFSRTLAPVFSDDLSRAVVWAYDLPAVTGDAAKASNIYSEDTGDRSFRPITASQADPISPFEFLNVTVWGASADASVVSFLSSSRLLPEAQVGAPNAYEWSDGSLRLAGILPDGTVPAAGSTLPENPDHQGFRRTVSADGSRVLFLSPIAGANQLYLRRDHSSTAWVSESESTVPVAAPEEVILQWVSSDGRRLLFTTTSKLLDEDNNIGPDLYLYSDRPDPASESNLTLVSHSGNIDGSQGGNAVLGAGDDGSISYFTDTGGNLYLSDHGQVSLITDRFSRGTEAGRRRAFTDAMPGYARVSPDGSRLVFLADDTQLDPSYGLTGQQTDGRLEMYVYDASRRLLTCASCPVGRPASSDATVVPAATTVSVRVFLPQQRPRYLSSDGRRVFFSTAESLVSADTNGLVDTYVYEPALGRTSLLSTGKGDDGVWFADAGAAGDDVFLVTRERLVRGDSDQLVDLYDVRVRGGFPQPPLSQPPCSGDGCRPPRADAPASTTLGTEVLSGQQARRRHRARHRKHRHRKHRLHSKHHRVHVSATAGGVIR